MSIVITAICPAILTVFPLQILARCCWISYSLNLLGLLYTSPAFSLVLFFFFTFLSCFFNPGRDHDDDNSINNETENSKLPLQLAIVGRPNVGKSTLLNTLLQEDRVLVGPEAGLTRDSIRAQFQYQGRTVFLVNAEFILSCTSYQFYSS